MSQALNETQVLISLEETLILYQQLLEGVHVSLLYTCHNEVVWKEGLLKLGVREHLATRNVSHKKLDNYLKLLHLDTECLGSNFRPLSEGLNESSLGLRVLQLHSFDPAKVVEIASVLVVRSSLGEGCLNQETSRLFI